MFISITSLEGKVLMIVLCIISAGTLVAPLYPSSFSQSKHLPTSSGKLKDAFSIIFFNKNGVYRVSLVGNDTFISWDDCADVGFSYSPAMYTGTYHLYFSKEPWTMSQVRDLRKMEFSDKHIWAQYTKELVEDVLKYIDKERIDRFECLDSKGINRELWAKAMYKMENENRP